MISAAPLPRAAIRAMAKLTEWTIEVYLVKDSVFEAALDAYHPASSAPVTHDADLVRDADRGGRARRRSRRRAIARSPCATRRMTSTCGCGSKDRGG